MKGKRVRGGKRQVDKNNTDLLKNITLAYSECYLVLLGDVGYDASNQRPEAVDDIH